MLITFLNTKCHGFTASENNTTLLNKRKWSLSYYLCKLHINNTHTHADHNMACLLTILPYRGLNHFLWLRNEHLSTFLPYKFGGTHLFSGTLMCIPDVGHLPDSFFVQIIRQSVVPPSAVCGMSGTEVAAPAVQS